MSDSSSSLIIHSYTHTGSAFSCGNGSTLCTACLLTFLAYKSTNKMIEMTKTNEMMGNSNDTICNNADNKSVN